ncbi:MAG TPA: trypsin-like serine protease [Vicinamibacterales bacterium]|nr:trypsin-like serine protease [Vicinamibacterales bacterium]
MRTAVLVACLAAVAACGGSSSPSTPASPTPTATLPAGGVCGALGGPTSIVNGSECPKVVSTSVVLLNLRNGSGDQAGACSGTVIARRAVLTAAHCVVDAAGAQVYLGSGTPVTAKSLAAYPGYSEKNNASVDVGVVLTATDLGVEPIPLLLGRDAHVGETAIIAGWGRDQNTVGTTLRAGLAAITAVNGSLLQTEYTTNASSVCQGDSGGPLLLSEGGVWAVAGIISANQTTSCAYGTNYYTNVRSAAASFILEHVPDAARR